MCFGQEPDRRGNLSMHIAHRGDHVFGHPKCRAELKFPLPLIEHVDRACLGPRNLRGRRDDRIEYRLQIEGRVDRLAHLAKRLQLFDRLREFAGARLHLVEQPHVLDRDHRLVSEGRYQLDLLVGEGAHLLAPQDNHPDGRAFAYERHAQS